MDDQTEIVPEAGHGIELIFPSDEIDHPDVFFSWCFRRETLEEVIRGDVYGNHHYLLLQVETLDEDGDVTHVRRQLISNTHMGCEYLRFVRPGRNRVTAILFTAGDSKSIEALFVRENSRADYRVQIPGVDGFPDHCEDEHAKKRAVEMFQRSFTGDRTLVATHVTEVEVPSEIFAKPWPKWLTTWVLAWSRYSPEDECDLRREALFAFSFQLILFPIWELLKRIYTFLRGVWLVLEGKRTAWRIMGLAFRKQFKFVVPTIELDDAKHYEHRYGIFKHPLGKWFRPLLTIPYAAAIAVLTAVIPGETFTMIAAAFVMHAVLFIPVMLFADFLGKRLSAVRKERRKRHHETRDERFKDTLETAQTYLGCGVAPSPKTAPLENPYARKSWRLRAARVKARVCRPFSG